MKIYVYNSDGFEYLYTDMGDISGAINDLGDDKDFTLTPPPDYEQPWYWVEAEWTTEQPS